MRGDQKNLNLFIKNCVFILTCLNFSHIQSTLHLMEYTYQDFFPLLKTVFELINFDAFWCVCHFLFHLFHISKMFPFEDFIHLGKQTTKKATLNEMESIERVGPFLVSGHFLWKTEHSVQWAGALINHPSWNGQTRWKSLHKKFTEAEGSFSQQRQLVHWYR